MNTPMNIILPMTTITALPLNKLIVDAAYQRKVDMRRVAKMLEDPKPGLVGVLQVSERSGGMFAVMDGGHRREFLARKGFEYAACQVWTGLTPQMEATMFSEMNNGAKPPTSLDDYLARRYAGDALVLEIDQITKRCGWVVGGKESNSISWVWGLMKIHKRGNLEDSLRVVTQAWGIQPFISGVLGGVSVWLQRHEHDNSITFKTLVERLRGMTCQQVNDQATGGTRLGGGQVPAVVADYLDRQLGLSTPQPVAILKQQRVRHTTIIEASVTEAA